MDPDGRPSSERLYYEFAAELLAFLKALLRDDDAAEEALQNTFQRWLMSGGSVRSETVRGWLFKVAYHEAMEFRRKQSVHERFLKRYQSQGLGGVQSEFGGGPEQTEDRQRVWQAVMALPVEQRDVVVRRIYREQTFAAIAEECGLPLGTVLTRMRLALKRLQRALHRDFPAA
jgi:RNA polymerase sigma factor (sigma-70 family)